jgi:dTMP kinase
LFLSTSIFWANVLTMAYIYTEGKDSSRKSSLTKALYQNLKDQNYKVALLQFPNRQSPIGKLIDSYLKKEIEFNIHTIHLLFAADQLNSLEVIEKLHQQNYIIIFDRSYLSNIAYYTARGGDPEYISNVSKFFPRPDLVIYCPIFNKQKLAQRKQIERFETTELQDLVGQSFDALKGENWIEVEDPLAKIEEIEGIVKKLAASKGIHPTKQ